MMVTFTFIMFILILSTILMMLSMVLSKKTILDREKSSPFECGFDPKSSARLPFSLRFFLIAVIFLIFDVEIALIMPAMIIQKSSDPLAWLLTLMFFIVILLLGLYHEWNQGALEWAE
uniref:NADH-ubiquinone oxidoreductase chain 3 n=1 Tax=Gryllodes sigillatus TaxID=13551 RepID=A0A7U0M7V3_9ORTH|nr:NADH dehydrogenase subunit 3 [Gryllodes sigillatus]QQX28018.1 NADH dehydrogenase subunit 3 [Gryllodes sigillatus]QWQ55683.1 NADH dehydrogenase subunit 3 [Gryllodes sigillatus]UBU97874.1 NADH dehydrogenase subunit 3 [Gryllodes sp.]